MKLSEEHILIREMVRKFAEKEITPIAEEMDKDEFIPDDCLKDSLN